MTLLSLLGISKQFNHNFVLKDVNFSVLRGEKIALIGKNGSGKSTFIKIVEGVLEVDSGERIAQNDLKILALPQQPKFGPTASVRDVLEGALDSIKNALKRLEVLNEILARVGVLDAESQKEYSTLNAFIDEQNGWDLDNKIEQILARFDLKKMENRLAISLSGGEQKRVALAKLLLNNADLILLDEPTNHLDIDAVCFLENYLEKSRATIIFISHDRYFIEKLATRVVEVDSGNLLSFQGGYTKFLEKKEEMLAAKSKEHENLIRLLRREEEWLNRGVRARVKRNEGRKERVLALREQAKKNPGIIRNLKIELTRSTKNFNRAQSVNAKKCLFELENITLEIASKMLVKNLSLRILQGEKIGIIGKNGSGKSSFLKMLLGEIAPKSGTIKRAEIDIGYFDQHAQMLDDSKTLLETFCPNGGEHIDVAGKHIHVYGYMKNFLFPKEFLTQKIGALSGGEKSRVALALLLSKKVDALIMDEPTNNLDIATINILEEQLSQFDGAVIFVSHDRFFVDRVAQKLLIFEDGEATESHFSCSEYYEKLSEINEVFESLETPQNETKTPKKIATKLSYKDQVELDKLPKEIEVLESKISELESMFSDPDSYNELAKNALLLEQLKNELESKTLRFLELDDLAQKLKNPTC